MQPIAFETHVTLDDYEAFMRDRRRSRGWRIVFGVWWVVVTLVCLQAADEIRSDLQEFGAWNRHSLFLPTWLLLCSGAYYYICIVQGTRRAYTTQNLAEARQTVLIGEDGVRITDEHSDLDYRWSAFRGGAKRTPDHILLLLSPMLVHILPLRQLPSPQDAERVWKIIERNVASS